VRIGLTSGAFFDWCRPTVDKDYFYWCWYWKDFKRNQM